LSDGKKKICTCECAGLTALVPITNQHKNTIKTQKLNKKPNKNNVVGKINIKEVLEQKS
jgi:hypothetical protein